MIEHSSSCSRRALLQGGLAAVVGGVGRSGADAAEGRGTDSWDGLKVGVASYTLRKMSVSEAIGAIRRTGLPYVSIKDSHLPLSSTPEERRAVAASFRNAGIEPLSCGVITMGNDEQSVRGALEYGRDIGVPTVVCSPHPDSMPLLDRLVKEFDMRLAIHNHGPGDKRFPTPYDVYEHVRSFDARIGLCVDVGHTARSGVDPAQAILKLRSRIYDIHIKDVDRMAPEGTTVEGGRGVIDLAAVLRALRVSHYSHSVSIEYEKDPGDPLPGLSETVGYLHGLLAATRKRRA